MRVTFGMVRYACPALALSMMLGQSLAQDMAKRFERLLNAGLCVQNRGLANGGVAFLPFGVLGLREISDRAFNPRAPLRD